MSMSVDEPNLVSHAGLVAVAELAQRLGVAERIDAHLDLSGTPGQANEGTKAMTVLGGLLAGADSIDDVAVLRTGALPQLFVTRAPSTIGTFLRSFTFGHVRQLDAVARELLGAAWAAGAGPAPGADVFVDVDSTICEVYGVGKQGAAFGYTKVRGYHPLLATCAGAAAGGGAGNFVTETLSRLRAALPVDACGRRGRVTLRADAGFSSRAVVRACRAADARFSLTVRMNPALRAAIAGIPDDGWTPIPYWSTDGTFGHHPDGTPVSGADVAEVPYTAFAGTADAVDVRLVVRRVRPTPGSQLALVEVFDHHAFITDRAGELLTVEAEHRDHAVVEQVIADLKGAAGLAHLPSSRFAANAAWLGLVGLAYNLARWAAALTGRDWARRTVATIRSRLLAVPGRLVHTARRLHLRLPENWPWAADLIGLREATAALSRT